MRTSRFCFIIMLIIASLLASGCQQSENNATPGNNSSPASWPYRFVRINGLLYVIDDKQDNRVIISEEQLGKKLGEVVRRYEFEGVDEPGVDGDSNYLPVGADLYEIANENWKQYIAVEIEDNVFVKAIEENLYLNK